MSHAPAFQAYLTALRKTSIDQKTEHTDRGALEILLNALAPAGISVQHEPKHAGDKGSPDYKVTKQGSIVGYVEVKTINENLDLILKSKQIEKYKSLSKNILLTDYLHFVLITGDAPLRHSIIYASELENPKHQVNPQKADDISDLLFRFFSTAPEGISRAQDLALALATRSHLLRDGLLLELKRQEAEHQQGKLYGLLGAFRTQVFHQLTLEEFSDAFAQMLSYGIFLARLNTEDEITLKNVSDFIPAAFPLIRELVNFLSELTSPDYAQVRWIVEEILSIMNRLNLAEIRNDLSFAHRKSRMRKVKAGTEEEHRLFERDPFVYFYEDFLAKYDAKLRKSRGVYYTPPPVVNFIIRAIDDILKSEFSIPDGLADHKRVTMLDFATGTGTFILEALERMFETVGDSHARRDLLVREHILKNIFGFEYLIAPYTIAHLKLSQYLADKGHKLSGKERLQVYLTNTLEPTAPQVNWLLPALSAEADKAQEIKNKPILVITGNPPYSGHSKNNGKWISGQVKAYKVVDGKALGEKNPKYLNDDYVKFIRFAQDKIDHVPEGIVGIITNHAFLDNPTFRGMRQSLMASFDKIYVLDLHGNTKRKEKSPDGTKDENVFDIEQGVSISLFIKTKRPKSRSIQRSDLWGVRLSKYESLARLAIGRPTIEKSVSKAFATSINWQIIRPTSPFYLFQTRNTDLEETYRSYVSVTEIFSVHINGFKTHRDDFAIDFTKTEIENRITEMRNTDLSDISISDKYSISNTRDWNIKSARTMLQKDQNWTDQIITCLYRPFDERWAHFGPETMDYPRTEFIQHCRDKQNLILGVGRAGSAVPERPWELAIVSQSPIDQNVFRRGGVNAFPLYLYHNVSITTPPRKLDLFRQSDADIPQGRSENISTFFRDALSTRYGTEPPIAPEQVFGYIYAIVCAPTFRARFAEFLRGDFPRIPLCESRKHFESLSALGWELAQKHLLTSLPKKTVSYKGKGDNSVDKPHYSETEQAVYINVTQYFAPVPEAIWTFHIGGYQVIDKYLKSRKGRTLTLEEVNNIENIVTVLNFTISQTAAIDQAYLAAFPGHALS